MFKRNKRGEWQVLASYAIGVLSFVVILAMGALILSGFYNTAPAVTQPLNASGLPVVGAALTPEGNFSNVIAYGHNGLTSLGTWIGVLIVVMVGALLIGLIMKYYGGRK
jgi:hypothetical protein